MWPFGKKKHNRETPEKRALAVLSKYVNRLLDDYSEELDQSEDKRLAFFAFLFGGVSALAMREGLKPPQVHAVALVLFMKGFGFTPEESASFAQFGINATARDSPWAPAAHAGMDEFLAWKADPSGFKPTKLRGILDHAPPRDAG